MSNHNAFLLNLVNSVPAQFAVARWMHMKGFDISIDGFKYAPDVGYDEYSDDGDITTPKGIVDVKHLQSNNFTDVFDHGYDSAVAGFKLSIDKLLAKGLYASIFVSTSMKHAYIVKASTKDQWTVKDMPDKVTKLWKPSYMADFSLCCFIDLQAIPKDIKAAITVLDEQLPFK